MEQKVGHPSQLCYLQPCDLGGLLCLSVSPWKVGITLAPLSWGCQDRYMSALAQGLPQSRCHGNVTGYYYFLLRTGLPRVFSVTGLHPTEDNGMFVMAGDRAGLGDLPDG